MTQITSGLRSILSVSLAYDVLQNILGARRMRRVLCHEYICAKSGMRIVDVGCGTALILEHLPVDVNYHGFDLSEDYVAAARKRYGHRGAFSCADITTIPADDMPPCDAAIAIGVLQHLDDDGARSLLLHLYQRLAPNGKLVTLDGVYCDKQSRAARALISRDRGQNVRTAPGYRALVPDAFSSIEVFRRDDLLRVPYTHAVMVCRK
jgi:SAM-dependent methyltransferase